MDDYKKQAKSDISLKKGKMVDVIEKRECGECFILSYSSVALPVQVPLVSDST